MTPYHKQKGELTKNVPIFIYSTDLPCLTYAQGTSHYLLLFYTLVPSGHFSGLLYYQIYEISQQWFTALAPFATSTVQDRHQKTQSVLGEHKVITTEQQFLGVILSFFMHLRWLWLLHFFGIMLQKPLKFKIIEIQENQIASTSFTQKNSILNG